MKLQIKQKWRRFLRCIPLLFLCGPFLGTIALFFPCQQVWAQQAKVEITTDKNTGTLEDEFQVQVAIVSNSNVDIDSPPQWPVMDAFVVENLGQSSQFRSINGETTVEKIFQYSFTPQKEGTFKVGPVQVKVDGALLTSNFIEMKVEKPSTTPATAEERPFFLHAFVDKASPYINEQIIYTLQVHYLSDLQIADSNLQLPQLDKFWRENLGDKRDYQVMKNGQRWNITEIKLALFPSQVGALSIDPAQLQMQVLLPSDGGRRRSVFQDSFFGGGFFGSPQQVRKLNLKSPALTLQVRALPEAGRPAQFSGVVGKLQMTHDISKRDLKVGDSATLTMTLRGEGNVRDAKLPDLHSQDFKTYEDKPILKTFNHEDKFFGEKTFKLALVPTRAGTITLPPLVFSYFNPELGLYQTAVTQEIPFNVAAGQGEQLNSMISATNPKEQKKEVKVLAEDLMPIKSELISTGNSEISGRAKSIVWGNFFLLPLLTGLFLWWRRKKEKFMFDRSGYLRERAFKTFKEKLRSLSLDFQFYPHALNLLREYISHKYLIDGKGMTHVDTERLLGPHVSVLLRQQVQDFFKNCEIAQYGGTNVTDEEKKRTQEKLLRIVEQLEKEG